MNRLLASVAQVRATPRTPDAVEQVADFAARASSNGAKLPKNAGRRRPPRARNAHLQS